MVIFEPMKYVFNILFKLSIKFKFRKHKQNIGGGETRPELSDPLFSFKVITHNDLNFVMTLSLSSKRTTWTGK